MMPGLALNLLCGEAWHGTSALIFLHKGRGASLSLLPYTDLLETGPLVCHQINNGQLTTVRGVFFFRPHLSFSSSFALLCLSSIFPFYTVWTSTVICVSRHCVPACECFPTLRTDKGSGDKVGIMIALEMHVKELFLAEGLVAVAAGIRLLPRVSALVHDHVPLLSTSIITLVALEALLIFV